jgi:exopolyphosphatase / guanosine-5'-triphosphate,3'-diphosphate pyrophosphatase
MPKPPSASRKSGVSRPQGPDRLPAFAALDLGTNNCRLLVARPAVYPTRTNTTLKVLDTFSRIVRLGEGVSTSGQLSEEAMERTITALKACRKKLDRYEVPFTRFVATEACRQAANTPEFLARVHKEAGIGIDVITNEEEAKLAFLGCSTLLKETTDHALVFDIGGGSTEFMWVRRDNMAPPEMLCEHRIIDWLSLNQGVMNLSEKFGGTAFAEVYFDELVGTLVKRLREFDLKNKISENVMAGQIQMLSTSGTLTTLSAIHLGLTHYERSKVDGNTFKTDELRDAVQKILAMRPSERFANHCIGPDRSDYIISGCAIFEAIMTLWPVREVTVADRGVREGIIFSLMQEFIRQSHE